MRKTQDILCLLITSVKSSLKYERYRFSVADILVHSSVAKYFVIAFLVLNKRRTFRHNCRQFTNSWHSLPFVKRFPLLWKLSQFLSPNRDFLRTVDISRSNCSISARRMNSGVRQEMRMQLVFIGMKENYKISKERCGKYGGKLTKN